MYAVEVRSHIMIAHSLPRPVFGPAQAMHGATFVVDATFFTRELDENGLAVDIGRATQLLADVLAPLNYANLDEVPALRGKVTTTEVISRHIFDEIAQAIAGGGLGGAGAPVSRLRVTLHESHVARGWYEAEL